VNSEGQNRGEEEEEEEEEEKSAWIINRMKEAWEKLPDQTLPQAPRPGNEKFQPNLGMTISLNSLNPIIIIITQFDLIGFLLDLFQVKLNPIKTWFGFL